MKKRLLSLLAMLLTLALLPLPALADRTYTVYVSSTGGSLNLRSGPGTNYGVNGYVMHGDTVSVLTSGDEWSEVRVTRTGKTGYIKTKYFDGTTAAQGGASSATTATVYVKSGMNLNLRSGAGTNYSILGYVRSGSKVSVLGYNGDWVNVNVPSLGKSGWIMTKYLNGGPSSGSSGSGSSGGTITLNNSVYRVTGSTVNLRSGAGTGYSVKRVLTQGTAFRVTGMSGNWYKITTLEGGYTGYISKNFSGTGATAQTTANLNMRSGAGTGNSVVQTVPKGRSVTVTSVTGNWAYVTYNGYSGYCSLNYLDF